MILTLSEKTMKAVTEAFRCEDTVKALPSRLYSKPRPTRWEVPDELIARLRPMSTRQVIARLGEEDAKELIESLRNSGIEIKGPRPWVGIPEPEFCPHCGKNIHDAP